MFDVSMIEVAVIALVALLVLGPEKLPRAARTAGAPFSFRRNTGRRDQYASAGRHAATRLTP